MAAPSPTSPVVTLSVSTAGNGAEVDLATLRDGRVVAAWYDIGSASGDVKHRIVDNDGTPTGGEVRSSTGSAGTQETPAVAALADGGFVIVWRDLATDALGDVRYRVYGADGTPVVEGFAIVSQARGQSEPEVTATADGGFVIGWTDRNGAETGLADDQNAIVLRKFAADGSAEGNPVRLSGTVGGDISVALASRGGSLLGAWNDVSSLASSGAGVYARGIDGPFPGADFTNDGSKISGGLSLGTTAFPDAAITEDGDRIVVM